MGRLFLGDLIMIAIENLTVSYQRKPAVHHVDMQFDDASMWAIFGPNGAGKSTLLKAVMGLLNAIRAKCRGRASPAATSPTCRSRPTSTAASR